MIRWLWKIIVGRPAAAPAIPCARECFWEGLPPETANYDHGGMADKWQVLHCKTCGDIKHHVIYRDGHVA